MVNIYNRGDLPNVVFDFGSHSIKYSLTTTGYNEPSFEMFTMPSLVGKAPQQSCFMQASFKDVVG